MKFHNAAIAIAIKLFGILSKEVGALSINVQGEYVMIIDVQYEYNHNKYLDRDEVISSKTITKITINLRKSIRFPDIGIDINKYTFLKFEFNLQEAADPGAICLEKKRINRI